MRKKKWVKPFLQEKETYLLDYYEKPFKTYLEIGMGMGDFIVASASMNPDIFYLGLEKDETCVARAIKKALDNNLDNLGIMLKDASNINEYIKEGTIDRIYLHFSDPWPKKRNHKRRLTYPTYLANYYKLLKDKGEIVLKTDNYGLFEDSLKYFKEAKYKLRQLDYNYRSDLIGEPMTAYQRKFTIEGKVIYYARYEKC